MSQDDFQPYVPQTVLVVGAHADDIDVTAGGSVAVWAKAGASVEYVVITDGCKGTKAHDVSGESIAEVRAVEQQNAAHLLGAGTVHFLGYEDSNLEVTTELKKDLVRIIRQVKPDTVVVMDPTVLYSSKLGMINHTDHRAAGLATLDAVYPLARDHLTFAELQKEGLEPHSTAHVLLTNFETQNYYVDISDTIDLKLRALAQHISQFPDIDALQTRMREFAASSGERAGYDYAEGFVRIDIAV
ncbi:MAG: PIG-L deacetylase family protein [Candidatus Saccharimonadales bacterium]